MLGSRPLQPALSVNATWRVHLFSLEQVSATMIEFPLQPVMLFLFI
jgi:hypothetical protein